MKDYTFDLEDKKEFILNYEIIDNDIIINFANGTKYMVPLTKTNEEIILKKMREQVLESEEYEEKLTEKIASKKISSIAAPVVGVAGFVVAWVIGTVATNDLSSIIAFSSVPVIAGSIIGCAYGISRKKIQRVLEDLEKNRFFLDNEEEIKKALTNSNVLANVNDNVKELANSKELNLNVIDSYSFEDLEEVTEFAGLEDSFEFEPYYGEVQNELVKPKTRKRKR